MDSNFVTVVVGLPRSGTSLMMQALEAGGILVLSDDIRKIDEDNPNPLLRRASLVVELDHIAGFSSKVRDYEVDSWKQSTCMPFYFRHQSIRSLLLVRIFTGS